MLSNWNKDDDEAIDISKEEEIDHEPDWKVVGSISRRESMSVKGIEGYHHPTPPNSASTSTHKQNTTAEKQWDLFGGFQWEETSPISDKELTTTTSDSLYDSTAILSVPMLPQVSLHPTYKPQRSFSFSIGQDPTFFGYDDYNATTIQNALAPTMEEEEDQDQFLYFTDTTASSLRTRSQSSNGTLGSHPLSSFWNNNQPTPMNNRRSSLGFIPFPPPNDVISQRRMSQPFISDFTFPNGKPTHYATPSSPPAPPPPPPPPQELLSKRLENLHLPKPTLQPFILPLDSTQDGKGISLEKTSPDMPLFMIEFKSGRTDFYYLSDTTSTLNVGNLVIVEADRGKDLGKIATDKLTMDQIVLLLKRQQHNVKLEEITVKKIFRQATKDEIHLLLNKEKDEQKALSVCLQKIKNHKLCMEVVDAEFQWDRRKLTFYFIAEKRIDFRELVRELFKLYKTRIWMCAVNTLISDKKSI